jgi:predicted nucleic acid-binding protein
MSDKVFLDTNVLVYAYDRHDISKHQRAQSIVQELTKAKEAVISAQVLGEFFVTVTRKIKSPLRVDEAATIVHVLGSVRFVETDRALIDSAIELHLRYQISYWDGLIIAAAERAGCGKVFSEDLSHGQQYGNVVIENPFRAPSHPSH